MKILSHIYLDSLRRHLVVAASLCRGAPALLLAGAGRHSAVATRLHIYGLACRAGTIAVGFAVLSVKPETASAHGFAGSRFFPATLSTDDPFVNDELSM
ncbi:MAG: hypothetical protein J2P56_09965, partial [Verrucomicrobia bacterium]|nr:hypothetical protein [Verrucomicrobiota bacterium]